MQKNIFSTIVALVLVGLWVLAIVGMIVKVVKNKYAPLKSVKAVVIDKQKVETLSKYSGNGKRVRCVIVFSIEGQKLSFYVSEFSFDGYSVNMEGLLTYKGDQIIEFN